MRAEYPTADEGHRGPIIEFARFVVESDIELIVLHPGASDAGSWIELSPQHLPWYAAGISPTYGAAPDDPALRGRMVSVLQQIRKDQEARLQAIDR